MTLSTPGHAPRTLFELYPIVLGTGLAILTILLFFFLSDRHLQECSAILLAGIAGTYWGFAAIDGRTKCQGP